METKKRIEFIDLAKGVCILLVIMMHTDVNVDFPGLRGMRMPLYFILSGLFFKDYGGFLNLLVKKANKILIPFLFFYLASYSIFYLIGWLSPDIIKSKATGISDLFTQRQLFNGPIWFLLALFHFVKDKKRVATGSPCFRNRWNRGIAGYISSIPSLLYRQCHECFAVFLLRLPFEKDAFALP